MRKEDFVVGKIYTLDKNPTRYYYVGPNLIDLYEGIFQNIFSNTVYSFLYESYNYEWKEYKEPRKGTRWMNVYSYPDGCIYTNTFKTKKEAETDGRLINTIKLACIEVPWVEGQGL